MPGKLNTFQYDRAMGNMGQKNIKSYKCERATNMDESQKCYVR